MKKHVRIRILLSVMVLIAALLLPGCNKDFEKEDADKLVRQKGINAEYIGEEIPSDERDTIWNYREKRYGLEFQVIEDHYTTGIDGSNWEESRLYTNYGYVFSDYFFTEKGDPEHSEVIVSDNNGYISQVALSAVFSNADELHEALEEIRIALSGAKRMDRNASMDIILNFEGWNFSRSEKNIDQDAITELEDAFFICVVAHYDEVQMSYYSNLAINDLVNDYRGRIYIKEGENRARATNVISLAGNTFLYRNALRHLLIDEGYEVSGDQYSFTVKMSDGSLKEFSEEQYYYGDIKETFGLELIQKQNLKN